jgi:hypothetical protein
MRGVVTTMSVLNGEVLTYRVHDVNQQLSVHLTLIDL